MFPLSCGRVRAYAGREMSQGPLDDTIIIAGLVCNGTRRYAVPANKTMYSKCLKFQCND